MPLDEASAKRYARKSAFLEFCEKDGLAVITGYGVGDRSGPCDGEVTCGGGGGCEQGEGVGCGAVHVDGAGPCGVRHPQTGQEQRR